MRLFGFLWASISLADRDLALQDFAVVFGSGQAAGVLGARWCATAALRARKELRVLCSA